MKDLESSMYNPCLYHFLKAPLPYFTMQPVTWQLLRALINTSIIQFSKESKCVSERAFRLGMDGGTLKDREDFPVFQLLHPADYILSIFFLISSIFWSSVPMISEHALSSSSMTSASFFPLLYLS